MKCALRTALALCLGLGPACKQPGTSAAPTVATPPTTRDAAAPAVDAPRRADAAAGGADPALEAQLGRLADSLTAQVAEVRHLAVRGPIARGVMNREAIVARLRARTAEEYPPGEVAREGEMLTRLGLLPEGFAYEQNLYDLLEEQVLGFYDPALRRLFIADWVPEQVQSTTMAHELTHALQDQHFQIARFVHHAQGRGDAQTAGMAVLEGDATAAMLEFALHPNGRTITEAPEVVAMILQQLESSQQPRIAAAPRAIRETLLFPYLAGLSMVVSTLRREGWEGVDALLRRPPESTEQVLHEARRLAREAPVAVPAAVPAALAARYERVYFDVMGELGAQQFFKVSLSDARSESAAEGWGGDCAMLLRPRGADDAGTARDALVWIVALDRGAAPRRPDAEAEEFAQAAAEVLGRRYVDRPTARIAGALAARRPTPDTVSLVARVGQRVLFADRIAADLAADLAASALSPR